MANHRLDDRLSKIARRNNVYPRSLVAFYRTNRKKNTSQTTKMTRPKGLTERGDKNGVETFSHNTASKYNRILKLAGLL